MNLNYPKPRTDDFQIVVKFQQLPIGIWFYYGFNEFPHRKINKTQVLDCKGDRYRATNPSCLQHIVRVPRLLYVYNTDKSTEELIQFTFDYQQK